MNHINALKDLSIVDYFLGIQVKHTKDRIHLSPTTYIIDFLFLKEKTHYTKGANSQMTSGHQLSMLGSDATQNAKAL